MSVNERAARALKEILQIPPNDVCADCGAPGKSVARLYELLATRESLELLRMGGKLGMPGCVLWGGGE